MKLVIGNKNYSSWSLRPWILLRHAGISFEEVKLSFGTPEFRAGVAKYSPSGRVPVLVDGDLTIWDSLAIAEYVAEKFPDKGLWPTSVAARAVARSACAEMHAGFSDLRSRMTMNCQVQLSNVLFDKKVRREVGRIVGLWGDCRQRFGGEGPFLFGRFSVADAFFAPVTIRFKNYGVELPPVARQYVDAVQALPAMQEWIAAAKAETTFYDPDEPYRETP